MVSSDKNNDDGLDSTACVLPGTICASDPGYVLDTSNTCTNDSYNIALPLFVPLWLFLALMAPLVVCFVFCAAKLLRLLLFYGNTSIRFISLEGVSLHLYTFFQHFDCFICSNFYQFAYFIR